MVDDVAALCCMQTVRCAACPASPMLLPSLLLLLRTWWMMPEPGFQKPMPYLAPAEARKSYTSLLV